MFKAIIVTGVCFLIAAASAIGMYVADNKSVHRSVANKEHTHYTKLNINFDKEICIEYYDSGSWFPVYVCQSR
jgi:hypothetical protein